MDATATPEAERPAHAPYGKACLSCVKSKTRCAGSDGGDKCERCNRLNKECQPAPTVRKKRFSKRPSSASPINKTTALEEKLDGIVQMLQRSQAMQAQVTPMSTTQGIPSQSINLTNDSVEFDNLNFVLNGQQTSSVSTYTPPTPAASCISQGPEPTFSCCDFQHSIPAPKIFPLETEAELVEYLQMYRNEMVSYLPIVCLPETITVQQMREERPFLWLVIRAICSKSSARQRALEFEARKTLGKELLIEGTRSLDLLLGALVFAGWGHYFVTSKPIISPIIQLAMSLAYDLGLTKPIPTDPVMVMLNFNTQGCPKPVSFGTNHVRSMEERRAVIGLFLISSIYANYFGRVEPLAWTPYLDECLQLLEEKMEYPTEGVLIHLVKLQLLCNKASVIPWRTTTVPQSFYVKMLETDLVKLQHSMSPSLKLNETLQLAHFHTIIAIHEHSLDCSPPTTTEVERIENLWKTLTATKSWFTLFFCLDVVPLFRYPQVSMPLFNQLAHCLIVLFRLSTFEAPGVCWDRKKVRQELDLGELVKVMAKRWEEIAEAAGLDKVEKVIRDYVANNGHQDQQQQQQQQQEQCFDEGPWAYTRKKLLVVAHFWELKLASMMQAEEGRLNTVSGHNNLTSGFGATMDQVQMDGLDLSNTGVWNDIWMSDVSGLDLSGPYF